MYKYEEHKQAIFTEEGQEMFLEIRDRAFGLIKQAGCVRLQEATAVSGSSWAQLACMDRLVELGELVEVTQTNEVWGQHRVFVKA